MNKHKKSSADVQSAIVKLSTNENVKAIKI